MFIRRLLSSIFMPGMVLACCRFHIERLSIDFLVRPERAQSAYFFRFCLNLPILLIFPVCYSLRRTFTQIVTPGVTQIIGILYGDPDCFSLYSSAKDKIEQKPMRGIAIRLAALSLSAATCLCIRKKSAGKTNTKTHYTLYNALFWKASKRRI